MEAFAEAVRLEPESLPYAYRYAESYYDLENPPWDEAMAAWQNLEQRVDSATEQQMMRLHQANVLLFKGDLDAAEIRLEEEFTGVLASQQERLVARLARLRNPPEPALEPVAEPVVPVAPAPAEPALSGIKRPFMVPRFRPVIIEEPMTVDSDGVVELHESQAGDTLFDLKLQPPETE